MPGTDNHQVKIRGYRIELGEIEGLLGSHPWIQEAVVVATATTTTAHLQSQKVKERKTRS